MSGDWVIVDDNNADTTDSVRKLIQRHVNCMSDDSKITRKRGLIDLKKETIARKLGGTLLQELSNEILKPTLKCLSDPSEKNRELATDLISNYLAVIPAPDETLPYVMMTLTQRLGQQEIIEPSEELRLQLLESVLMPCIELSGKKIAGYLDEVISILTRTIVDPYAEVRKMSCKITCKFARSVPEHFHMQSASLIKPLMMSITHQHSKVRVAVIEATADVIQYGSGKNMDDVISHLAQRFFDPAATTRMAVTRAIGRWLLELPDRYSFWHKLIPLILTSFSDEMPDIRSEARRLWNKAGLLYQEENEKDLKDKMDFGQPIPLLYPATEERPCLGCRELVHRNLSKLFNGIIKDLGDWVLDTRIKMSQLLYQLLLHAEEYTTQHMQPLQQALVKACHDDEPLVVNGALRCAELVGAFVKPDIFCKVLFQTVHSHANSHAPLLVLSSTIDGCRDDVIGECLPLIIKLLVDPDICQSSEKANYHMALLKCVKSLYTVCAPRVTTISLPLFKIIVTVQALCSQEPVAQQCDTTLCELATAMGCQVMDLYVLHTKEILEGMKSTYETWTNYSVEQQVFNCLLSRAGPIVGEVLYEVIPILEANLHPDKEPELKLKLFTLLSDLLMKSTDPEIMKKQFTDEYVESIILKMIAPNLVWKAGRTSAAVRTIAMATMWAMLKSGLVSKGLACRIFEDMLAKYKSCLEDDAKSTRLTTVKVLTRLFYICEQDLSYDKVLHDIYLDLLKRMDDAYDEIRVFVTKTWKQYFMCFKSGYDPILYKAHIQAMYEGLLVHMDDPDADIQNAVQDALKVGGKLSPSLLCSEIEKVKHKHRTTHYCNQLIEEMQKLASS